MLAKQREFTEPFLIEDKTKDRRNGSHRMRLADLKSPPENGFSTLPESGKTRAALYVCVRRYLTRNTDGTVVTIGLGDSADDISMLKRVDIPILLPRI